ncbi:uncharacterized protein LOC112466874 [Temnothorax curvispinosus]|uniref:Uncharacterized protein LOC112466874 n=1 Tax=Temnothorax curvispinosus TaxID=300111 RepID=A0A6J1R9S5_9HYME|nr:uncharacterized protein LOC112466874 [Temnothorax curvispinosus]
MEITFGSFTVDAEIAITRLYTRRTRSVSREIHFRERFSFFPREMVLDPGVSGFAKRFQRFEREPRYDAFCHRRATDRRRSTRREFSRPPATTIIDIKYRLSSVALGANRIARRRSDLGGSGSGSETTLVSSASA